MNNLIERYVYDVVRRLPEKTRSEVAKELREVNPESFRCIKFRNRAGEKKECYGFTEYSKKSFIIADVLCAVLTLYYRVFKREI